jgi:hypothetical protein
MVCKSAVVSILAAVDFVRVGSTEFGLVLLRVIEFLNSIVTPDAAVAGGTLFPMSKPAILRVVVTHL